MKTAVFALGALAALVAAQDLTNIPECGRFCVNDMLNAKAVELGCAANDLKCLCTKKDFAYGLRDCSAATCGEDKAGPIVAYGVQVCKKAGVEITNAPTGTGGSPTATGGGGNTGTGTTSPTAPPATTATTSNGHGGGAGGVVTTITSDGSTIVTTLPTKTSGAETSGMATVTTGVTKTTGATESGTGGGHTGTGGATGGAGTETGGAGTETGGVATTTSPGAAMPQRTAAPAGIIAAAGLAALLL